MAKEFAYCSSGCSRPQFDKQVSNINKKYPNAIIIKELYSKTVTDRTELKKLMAQLDRNDTLIVNSMDRLSRDPKQLLSYYNELSKKGVNVIFINQPYMNTDVYLTIYDEIISQDLEIKEGFQRLLEMQITRVLEKSWEDLQENRGKMKASFERSRAEAAQADKAGKKRHESRKAFMVKELIRKYNQNYDGSMNDVQTMAQIREEMGTISRNTYYKYKKELLEDGE